MPKVSFDAERLYAILDSHRISRNLTWKQVAEQSGVSASTLTRMSQGRRPDVDTLAALLEWSGESTDSFMASTRSVTPSGTDTLASITAQFRADNSLSAEARKALETTIKVLYEQFRTASER
jgi:transcriptional regulator with XRE-family HTH domain